MNNKMNNGFETKNNKRITCLECNGIGLVKTKVKICEFCDGHKCIQCGSTGLEVKPYSECPKCDGSGLQDPK